MIEATCRWAGISKKRYEGVRKTREEKFKRKHQTILPIMEQYNEFKTFGRSLLKMPEKKAEGFMIIQDIVDVKQEIERKRSG